ncbi:MAG: formate dehydrogenase accessory protein FdhE [Sphingobium sp.]|nr:formate dehydrogenase accessory protein FdhE [Sphingobium sp.]
MSEATFGASARSSVPSEESTRHFEPLLRPVLADLYARRAGRLRDLSDQHDLAEYLRLCAHICEAQAHCLDEAITAVTHVDPAAIARTGGWPKLLDHMLGHLRPQVPDAVKPHLDTLIAMSEADRRDTAQALAEGRFSDADAATAPFIWAALSVEVSQLARIIPLPEKGEEETANCPICGTAPVASLIHNADHEGMRYLHCVLCECEWHMVRAKCSNCGDAGDLDYLSFDTPEASIRAEACGACGGYLKVISQERDADAELVADDLASLLLDDAARLEGFGRSGFNPFALPVGPTSQN